MKISEYRFIKVKPKELEYKAYLYQLLTFIDKRSFLDLAYEISDYIYEIGISDSHNAFWYVSEISFDQIKSILLKFDILPDYLYYSLNDEYANYQLGAELDFMPILYDSLKEVKLANGKIIITYRAGGNLLDLYNAKGYKLEISEEDDERIEWHESSYFLSCKISHDKQCVLLEFLGRMAAFVEYYYTGNEFILKTEQNSYSGSIPKNYYSVEEIDKIINARKRLKIIPATTIIGNQEWLTCNLGSTCFLNGDSIRRALSSEEWEEAAMSRTPAWCYYDNNPENDEIYGKLYNWFAVSDPRGLAPDGWRIPTIYDWQRLNDYLSTNVNIKLQGGDEWRYDNSIYSLFSNKKETKPVRKIRKSKKYNETGFYALPGGGRGEFGNSFFGINDSAYWWTSTIYNDGDEGNELEKNNEFIEQNAEPDKDLQNIIEALFGDNTEESGSSQKKFQNKNIEYGNAQFTLLYANDEELQIGNITSKKAGFSVRCVRDL